MGCRLVKSQQQFRENGCDNCMDKTETTPNFQGYGQLLRNTIFSSKLVLRLLAMTQPQGAGLRDGKDKVCAERYSSGPLSLPSVDRVRGIYALTVVGESIEAAAGEYGMPGRICRFLPTFVRCVQQKTTTSTNVIVWIGLCWK